MKVLSILFFVLAIISNAHAKGNHGEEHKHSDGHSEEHKHNDGHNGEHEHDEEHASHIPQTIADAVGIATSTVMPQTLQQTVIAYGALNNGPEQLSHVRARFAGLIKTVRVTVGDQVQAGDLLAEVESNESLKIYQIRAPITGLIVQRHANTGEATQDQILFSVADFSTLWAELRIYPEQQHQVRQGQAVEVQIGKLTLTGNINHVIPVLDKPYQLARVKLHNQDSLLSPGLLVEGRIAVANFSVAKAVVKEAVHLLDGQSGVFVKQQDTYRFAPLQLGRSDGSFYEVLSGVNANEVYVSRNSYLLKADIEKSAAEHAH